MRPLLVSALALLVVALPARAQTSVAPTAPSIALSLDDAAVDPPVRIAPRLVRAIESGSSADRAAALHAVVTQAYSAEGADLRPALGALLAVCQSDPDARHRILALRALERAGDDYVMSVLRSEASRETDPEVQWLLFAVLVDHYGVESLRYDDGMVALAQSIRGHGRP